MKHSNSRSAYSAYDRIEEVFKNSATPLASFEFQNVRIRRGDEVLAGDEFVGVSESTLERRMREMRAAGRLASQVRKGASFKEYWIVKTPAAEPAKTEEPSCPV